MTSDPLKPRPERRALHPERLPKVELFLSLLRAHDAQLACAARLLQQYGVTHQQFNVLRILYVRDEEGHGVSCSEIGQRLLTRVPDITRLLDRLAKAGLVERYRCAGDRRVVRARLTKKGHLLTEEIDGPLMAMHESLCADLSDDDIEAGLRLMATLKRVAEESA